MIELKNNGSVFQEHLFLQRSLDCHCNPSSLFRFWNTTVQYPAGVPRASNELAKVVLFRVCCAIRYRCVGPCDDIPERMTSWRGGDFSLGPFRRAGIASIAEQVSVPAEVCARTIIPSALKHSMAWGKTTVEDWTGRHGLGQAKEVGLCNGYYWAQKSDAV